MNPFLRKMFGAIIGSAVAGLAPMPSARAATSQPLYNNTRPLERRLVPTNLDNSFINLTNDTGAAPATTIEEANSRFSARAAEAIRWTVNHRNDVLRVPNSVDNPTNLWGAITGHYNEQNFGYAVLAMMAYKDYFNDDDLGDQLRTNVYQMLLNESAGIIGTSADQDFLWISLHWHGEYDVLLQSYIALYYKYYDVLPQNVRDKLINELLSVRGQGPGLGIYLSPIIMQELIAEGGVGVLIPESENHTFMIEVARYLTNQLLYQQTHNTGQFDNSRNGDGDNRPPLVDYILKLLRDVLKTDFNEYNSRDYQNYTMVAILNLATYAYDDRVRLAARMVLDYVSAKVAVSSIDLRRSTPYRRRNEVGFYGPIEDYTDPRGWFECLTTSLTDSDPQTAFYSMLAGNTAAWNGRADWTAAYGMVHAGIRDYHVPPSVLDLFVTPEHRRFYQRFHHDAYTVGGDTGEFADELYAGSPNYLISAGGHPTYYSSVAIQAVGVNSGNNSDLGLAIPTTFIPSYALQPETTLSDILQSGWVNPEITKAWYMGVAPDFLCGGLTELPDALSYSYVGGSEPWVFIEKPGWYLALYRFGWAEAPVRWRPSFCDGAFMEAFDTSLHPGVAFTNFVATVLAKNGATAFQFPGQNTYETYAGQQILFRIDHGIGDIISTTDVAAPAGYKDKFAYGTILNSEQGSATITISNPSLGQGIILDMHDQNLSGDPLYGIHHPSRTSESGAVESAGGNEELWVDFNSPANMPEAGDVYQPYKTLTAARDHVAWGGTVNIVPGAKSEPMTITKAMTLKSFPGSAILGHN
jgi:hypothetical protein